jgi:hypothetical protein
LTGFLPVTLVWLAALRVRQSMQRGRPDKPLQPGAQAGYASTPQADSKMRRTSRNPTMLLALAAVVVASHAAGEQNGQRTAYEPKPGDFVVVCTLFNGRPPGATASTPTEPITYDPRFAVGARVERIALGESPWRAGDLVTFVIHSPTLLLGPSFAGQQFALTFSPLRPRTNSDKRWFDPETRYLLQRIEPMQAFKSRDSEAAVRQQSGGRSADRGLDLRCLSADQMSCGCSLKIVALSCQASHSTGWIAHFASDLHQGSPLRLNLGGRDISLRSRRPVTNAFPYGKGDRWVEEYEGEGLKVAIRYRPAKSTCPADKGADGCEYFDVAADVVISLAESRSRTYQALGTCGC